MPRIIFVKVPPQPWFCDQKVREAEKDACLVNTVPGDILMVVTESQICKKSTANKFPFGNSTHPLEQAECESLVASIPDMRLALVY